MSADRPDRDTHMGDGGSVTDFYRVIFYPSARNASPTGKI